MFREPAGWHGVDTAMKQEEEDLLYGDIGGAPAVDVDAGAKRGAEDGGVKMEAGAAKRVKMEGARTAPCRAPLCCAPPACPL